MPAHLAVPHRHHVCLTALEQRGRRALPSGLGGPAGDPDAPPAPAEPGLAWLQPIPDALVTPVAQTPRRS